MLLRGGRPVDPRRFYLGYRGVANFLNAIAAATYGLYVVREAGLSPLELVLVGTALELSAFAFEVPTGVVADVYSRRLSVLIGVLVTGVAWIVMAAIPGFLFVALGQVTLGLGFTFRSGALEAWLADEIGEERAAASYLRGSQLSQIGFLVGIPIGVFAATIDLQAPMLAAGALHLLPCPRRGAHDVGTWVRGPPGRRLVGGGGDRRGGGAGDPGASRARGDRGDHLHRRGLQRGA